MILSTINTLLSIIVNVSSRSFMFFPKFFVKGDQFLLLNHLILISVDLNRKTIKIAIARL